MGGEGPGGGGDAEGADAAVGAIETRGRGGGGGRVRSLSGDRAHQQPIRGVHPAAELELHGDAAPACRESAARVCATRPLARPSLTFPRYIRAPFHIISVASSDGKSRDADQHDNDDATMSSFLLALDASLRRRASSGCGRGERTRCTRPIAGDAMTISADKKRALLEVLGLEDTADGRRALSASLRAAADDLDGSAGVLALSSDADDAPPPAKRAQRQKPFDFTKYPSRHVALHVMYAGWNYHGFASQGADASGVDTVETQLFAALKKCRLIAPDATWQSCDYTRCGRTDAGVSALSQVITLRLRAKRPAPPRDPEGPRHGAAFDDRSLPGGQRRAARVTLPAPPPPTDDDDELDYPNVLNRALPDDVRILGWSYVDADFSARFDCAYRHYKYFFASWGGLDLEKMREAARAMEGEHDFRNMCKMDAKNVHNYVRRVYRCEVVDAGSLGETKASAGDFEGDFERVPGVSGVSAGDDWSEGGGLGGIGATGLGAFHVPGAPPAAPGVPPRLCYISVKGTAFLWHQVRCMASVLFLVGLGREEPSVVRHLLDLEKTPRKPQFEMAPEEPLLLWNSGFEPGTVEWQLSRGASEQLVQHVAQSTQRHLVRAGIWAESWAHLRRRAAGLPGIGETRSNARGDTSDHPMEPEDAREGRSMGVPAEVISAVTALAPSGRVGSGGNARAKHVKLADRATEPTYEERREQLRERGGGTVREANSYRATVESFVQAGA